MSHLNEDLMKPIEAIVRPINASVAHKMRMREELYGHLELIIEEERLKNDSYEEVLKQAINRLGKPDVVRSELQGTVSKREQLASKYGSLVARKQSETRLEFAVRTGVCFAVLQSLAYVMAILICDMLMPGRNMHQIAPLLGVISLLMGWNTFLGVYLSQSLIELNAYRRETKSSLAKNGFLFGLSIGVSEVMMWLSIPGELANMNITIPQTVFPTVAGWGMFCLVVSLLKLERNQVAPWELIQLED